MNETAKTQGFCYRKTKKVRGRSVKAGFYRARYVDASGQEQDHVIVLPNGVKVRDRDVAESELRKILNRVEREAAGMVDPMVKSASVPMRVVLARYIRHLRGRAVTRSHVDQSLQCVKWIIDHADAERLADFNETNLEKALCKLADSGRSPRTVNVYRRCAHSLAEWCMKIARMIDRNPVAVVTRRNESTDVRKVRRALSVDEAYKLLAVAGPRRTFYAVQLWTGLRVSEVAALEWRDIDLDGGRPCIRLRAATTKAKRADEVPLHPDLAELLRSIKPDSAAPTDRIASRVPGLRTLCGGWMRRGGERVRTIGDIDRAGIPLADDRGRTIDRHALRTTFISWLGLYGVDPRAQIALARHAPVGITLRNYQDFSVFDLWAEIGKLPPIGDAVGAGREKVRATGTDGAVAFPVALGVGRNGEKQSQMGRKVTTPCHQPNMQLSSGKIGFFASQNHSGRQDSNLRPPAPKAGALAKLRHAPWRVGAYHRFSSAANSAGESWE